VHISHPGWSAAQVEAQAKAEFEAAALNLFVTALQHASAMRPKTLWGFYGMPQGVDTLEATQKMLPVWQASGALYPSIYETSGPVSEDLRRHNMNATIAMSIVAAKAAAAANKQAKRIPVYAYAWECYHNGTTLLTPEDLQIDMLEPYLAPPNNSCW
jgi:hypothetical protein